MKNLLLLPLLLMVISCGHSTDSTQAAVDTIPMMVMQIQKCSRLYTTEYHVHKIITHGDEQRFDAKFLGKHISVPLPMGSRKVAIPLDATLKAYIDFNSFTASNIHRSGNKIEVFLTDPVIELTSTRIDHKGVKQSVSLLRRNFTDAELAHYEQQGRKAIIDDIANSDITESARENASSILIPILEQMGYKEKDITITFRRNFAPGDIQRFIEYDNNETKQK